MILSSSCNNERIKTLEKENSTLRSSLEEVNIEKEKLERDLLTVQEKLNRFEEEKIIEENSKNNITNEQIIEIVKRYNEFYCSFDKTYNFQINKRTESVFDVKFNIEYTSLFGTREEKNKSVQLVRIVFTDNFEKYTLEIRSGIGCKNG